MLRSAARALAIMAMLVPTIASAQIDTQCNGPSATSAIEGTVQNAKGVAVPGMKVELYTTNRNVPTADSATTDSTGHYRICTGQVSGSYYDTFDVHVRNPDNATAPLYASANQPYATYLNPTAPADFTPASGIPLVYMANLTISPNAITTATAPKTVTWTVRSKAPSTTTFQVTLGYPSAHTATMSSAPAENGGPSAGGWNVWTYSETIAMNAPEKQYWATARGFDSVEVTQSDTQPYSIDNSPVLFGVADATACGTGVYANGFLPKPPLGTTNHQPLVTHEICDPPSNGARTSPDPFSLKGWNCPTASTPVSSCTPIDPVLSTRTIVWHPSAPLADGDYFLRWQIADNAGNISNSTAQWLKIGNTTGQVPLFTAISPGNFAQGAANGLIVGSSLTSPSSFPTIGFKVLDADGQSDIVPGSLRVRVYYGTDANLVYDYDATKARTEYDAITKKGGADFDLAAGQFKASGYPLQAKPPGRYSVSASVTDYGGNNATISWHFILVAAV